MRALVFTLLGILLSGTTLAAVPTERVLSLMSASGIDAQLDELPELVSASVEQGFRQSGQLDNLPPRHIETMQSHARADFAPERLKTAITQSLSESLDNDTVDQSLDWLDSESGQLITAVETASATVAGVTAMQSYIQNLPSHPPTQQRLAQISALDDAGKIAESLLRIQHNAVLVMLVSMNAAAPVELQRSFADLSALTDQLLNATIRQELVVQTSLQLVYTYRDVPDADLDAYIAHLESPTGSRFVAAGFDAFEQALFEAGLRFGSSIGEVIQQLERESES